MYKFSIDTGVLWVLCKLQGSDLLSFKNQMKASSPELSFTHVQFDEAFPKEKAYYKEMQNYEEEIRERLKTLDRKGIKVHVERTKGFIWDVSRWGYATWGSKEINALKGELRKEIENCEKAKRKAEPHRKPKSRFNIARDSEIAVSSLDHDFFVTCDCCLSKSWKKVIDKNGMLCQNYKIPKIILSERSPTKVAKEISKCLL
jgi:hypothetical protein